MRALLLYPLRLLSTVTILCTFLSYLAPWVSPIQFRWLAFFGTAFPWWLILNGLLLLFWAWRLDRFALYHAVILLFGWSHFTAFVGLKLAPPKVIPPQSVTIVTHNLGHLFKSGQKVSDTEMARIAGDYVQFLKKNGTPDILCTQETRGEFYRRVAEALGYTQTFNLKKGTVILSRLPMEAGGDIPFGKTSNSTLWVNIKMPNGQSVRVYNVHLQSNKVTTATDKVIEAGELSDEKTWQEINRVIDKVGGATVVRTDQTERLAQHLAECPLPAIVCGDFNDTPNSYTYHLLADGRNDTFQDAGFGLGTTFAGSLPFLRIDYILTDPVFRTIDCQVVRDSRWSDHYPVWATVSSGQ
jgi:endonuclease/exonuclease/phosphatase family metal-dependent hydrolase